MVYMLYLTGFTLWNRSSEVEKAKSVQILNVKYNHSVPIMTNIPQEIRVHLNSQNSILKI